VYIIREAKPEDLGTLMKLAKMVHFINLPADKDVITQKIVRSREAFRRAASGDASPALSRRRPEDVSGLAAASADVFMFVLEDTESGACLGTSQVVARMGGKGNPNYSFRLSRREFFSTSLQTGTSHQVARLHADESGPTEMGGLILQPASRGHRLGQFLSLIRFHFVALHRAMFADRVIAEMMGPITLDGQNMLWEHLGRRFIPLSYAEADTHCQRSREFIAALLPAEDIYLSLLPPEARDVVGRVGEETLPARRLLERLGFAYKGFVDPFDGGPHLEARTDDIPIVRDTRAGTLGAPGGRGAGEAFVSVLTSEGEFRAVRTEAVVGPGGRVRIPAAVVAALEWKAGQSVGFTPLSPPARVEKNRSAGGRRRVRT
jgi:arginine N-succinyltransferase